MARGTQLNQLVEDLRVKVGDSTRTEVGVDQAESYKVLLRKWQEWLYDEYDWPFMQIRPIKPLVANGRFYDLPEGLTLESIQKVRCLYNGNLYDTNRGINPEDYARYNPLTPDTNDPVRKWDVQFTGTAEQIEVWPVPETSTELLFTGKKDLSKLIDTNDTADLDDILIVTHAAVEILARKNDPSAERVAGEAMTRLMTLQGKTQVGKRPYSFLAGARPDPGFIKPWDDSNFDTYWSFYSDPGRFLNVR